MKIIVPASSANLGPGFDSIGIALSLHLTVTVVSKSTYWLVDHQLGASIPSDERNMIVATALKLAPQLQPYHLRVSSNIPVSHGLGSSSTAIVAGIEIANRFARLNMTTEEKVEYACQLEGHPDNVAPAILGGLVVGTNVNGHFTAIPAPLPPFDFVAYIPPYNLATRDSRAALPAQLPHQAAVHGSAIANTLVAGLFTQNYQVVGTMMQADSFHEPFRADLVPELAQIRQIGRQRGALATYLSGAGPTVMTLIKPVAAGDFSRQLQAAGLTGRIELLHPDTTGLQVVD